MADNEQLMLDVGQANELKLAFRRAGWTNADIKKACEGEVLSQVLPVVRGLATVNVVKHIIDLDANPVIPDSWSVVEHRKGGQFEWNPKKVRLYLSEGQQNGKTIKGHDLQQELQGQLVFNANLLDYLLAHQELIPEVWKGKSIFFWGTVYRDSGGYLYVRYLFWSGDCWHWDFSWLDFGWNSDSPAAVSAS